MNRQLAKLVKLAKLAKLKRGMNLQFPFWRSPSTLTESGVAGSRSMHNFLRRLLPDRPGQSPAVWLLSIAIVGLIWLSSSLPAFAMLTDDRFDGNIFPLYAGNGSVVPPKVTLSEALQRQRPIILVFYVDDSRDCKEYASVISRLDGAYGWAADIIALSADMLPVQDRYEPTEPGYYYKGYVPQTVIFNAAGQVVLDAKGAVPYEQVDDVLREVFDLLPRSESVELKRRMVNELSTEIVEQKVEQEVKN